MPDTDGDIIIEARLFDESGDEYILGIVKDGLGWVSEANLQKMAEMRPDRIYFFFVRKRDERDTW